MSEAIYETFEDELDAIRLALYEETKGMSPEEQIIYLNKRAEPVCREFNIQVSDLEPVVPYKRQRSKGEVLCLSRS